MSDNGYQKKQLIAEVFDRAASGYGQLRYIRPFGQRLVELAQLPAGAKVLDVATGRGAILFPAAEKVGVQGSVIGLDLSKSMVLETSMEVRRHDLMNVQVYCMDAEKLEFPDATFDSVLCGFALFFFTNLQSALAEFRRVLKPQGQLAVSTWAAEDERWDWYDELLAIHGASVKFRTQRLDQRQELEDALQLAGFSDIQIITEGIDIAFVDEAEWWAAQWATSGRAGLERLTQEALKRFMAEAFEKLQAQKQPDGFHYLYQAHFGLASKV